MCGADFLASALCNRLGNFLHLGAGDKQGNIKHVVSKCLVIGLALSFSAINQKKREMDTHRVGSDVNSLLLAVLNQVIALEHGVALDLVGGRDNTGAFNESLELRECISYCMASSGAGRIRTCSILWLETPTERALLLGSWVIAERS